MVFGATSNAFLVMSSWPTMSSMEIPTTNPHATIRATLTLPCHSAGDDGPEAWRVMEPAAAIGPCESLAERKVRRHQAFFRQTVLSSYVSTCAVCGLDLQSLIVASHIIPWATEGALRVDPRNGICLCSIHDRAFDRG